MPLPILLGGLALAAAGYGAKKGLDAKDDFDKAKRTNKRAKRMYDEAHEKLENSRQQTQTSLELLGKRKLESYGYVVEYIDEYNKITNREIEDFQPSVENQKKDEFYKLKHNTNAKFELEEIVHGGTAALGAGGLAGLASYGAVGTLATASTGTAIGGLSGVAATNATLAWLGGGALSAGGFGMAGGAVVLGGIVAGPVLAIGGMIMSSKAEAAKNDAYTILAKSEVACEEMLTAEVKTSGIRKRVFELDETIEKLNTIFKQNLVDFKNILNKKRWFFFSNTNWKKMQDEDKKQIIFTELLAKTLLNLLEVNLLKADGEINSDSQIQLEESNKLLGNFDG